MKVRCLASLLAVFSFFLFPARGQCDLVLTDVNIEAGTFTIEFLNTTNCGGTGGPDGVSEIQLGFQALDPDNDCAAMNQGWIFPSGYGLSETSNHPGWTFSSTSAELPLSNWTNLWPDWPWDIDPPYYAGETITFPLYNQYQSDCVNGPFANSMLCNLEGALNYWIDEGYSIQAVIWQISYGPTMYADNGGWAEVGGLGGGITPDCCGLYEDENFEDNWIVIGPCADPNPGPDAVIGNIEFNIGCIGDIPFYNVDYTIYNYGDEEITDYCVEIWNEDYYQCYNSDLFNGGTGGYAIPVGEGQAFSTPFFEYNGIGNFFTMTVDSVNGTDEIVTGNNNTTLYYPDFPTCPIPPDTVYEVEVYVDTLTIVDVIDSLIYITDTLYVELPPDTIIELEIDTVYIPWEWYIYDTVYVDNFIYDTTYVDSFIYVIDTLIEYVDNYIFDTTYVELPPDTITITEIELVVDTLYIDNYIYEYDTIYVDVPYIDTVYVTETEYIVDTLYITEWVTITDTITEYIVQELWIDCNTGLPCDEDPPGIDCPDWATLLIPNTFTPNNDGLNDVWQVKYDLGCWEDVEFEIYNRWGNKIYHGYGDSFDSYPYWDGSINGGSHYAQDGIYVYLVKGKKIGRAEVVKKQGYISIFR